MKKVFFDTNIFVRFLVQDDIVQAKHIEQLLSWCYQGKIKPYTSSFVLLELQYVACKVYTTPQETFREFMNAILELRGLTVIDTTDFTAAWALHCQTNVKLSDCLIATQVPPQVDLCTLDREFKRLPHVQLVTPEDILTS